MARILAVWRVLLLVSKRELKSLGSVGTNNLLFCVIWLMPGGTKKQAFESTLLFQMVMLLPLMVAMAADTLARIPAVRLGLWPLTGMEKAGARVCGLALNPGFWLVGLLMGAWGGVGAGVGYVSLAVVLQGVVMLAALLRGGGERVNPVRWVPRLPGALGGVMQVGLRQMMSTLDLWAAVLLCGCGVGYRWLSSKPQDEAMPILSMLVAIALSTFAQRMFGLETAGSMARYRLMPVRGWRILLAKDAVFLVVTAVLCAPLNLRAGMATSLMAVAIGRYPSVKERVRQRAWRFVGGDYRFGIAQVLVGVLVGLGSVQGSGWFLVGAAGVLCWVGLGGRALVG